MLQTPSASPGAGSQRYPPRAAEANADGSTTSTWALRSRRGGRGQLDPDRPRQGTVHHLAPVQPPGLLLRHPQLTWITRSRSQSLLLTLGRRGTLGALARRPE